MSRSARQWEAWVVIGLLMLTLFSRVPFRSQILYHWDSVNFAFGMREFSVAKEQPQPPGYIVYVWLCRLVDVLFHDPQTTMVWISVVASALAVGALFLLGRALFDGRIGVLAALFLATSPLYWFYGEIALPHSLDALLVIAAVWGLYETMRGRLCYLYPTMAVLAIAGGVRQQTLIFLLPLTLFALRKVGWKHFLAAGALGTAMCLAWFIPLLALSGSLDPYLKTVGAYSARFNATTSIFAGAGWAGVRRNLSKLGLYTLFGWSAALPPFVAWAAVAMRSCQWTKNWEKPFFFVLWLAPAGLFYTFVHMGQQGLVFIFLPALLLLSAAGLVRLLAARPRWLVAAAAIIVTVNTGILGLVPEYPLGPGTQRLLTRETLVNSDRYYQDRFEAIEGNFAPASTAILAAHWHHVEYYLPAYARLPFNVGTKWERDEGAPKGSAQEVVATPAQLGLRPDDRGQATIVVFDPQLMTFSASPALASELPLPNGETLQYFTLADGQTFFYDPQAFGVMR